MSLDATLGYITKSDGSAQLRLNNTCTIVAVYGPAEVKIMKEIADRAYISVVYKPLAGLAGIKEKSTESKLRGLFDEVILTHLHPRTSINLIIQEVQNDGCVYSCIINNCCLALLDANVPLKCTFAAVTCGLTDDTNDVIPFPSIEQEQKCSIMMTFVFESVNNCVIMIDTNGIYTRDQFNLLKQASKIQSQQIFNKYKELIKNKYKNDLKNDD